MSAYLAVKLLHVILAVVAVGYNASYGVVLRRMARQPESSRFALETVRALDRIANWCYVGLLVTGLGMAHLGHYPITTLWILASLIILVVALGLAGAVYTPALKKQLAALQSGGPDSPEFRRYGARGTVVGLVLVVAALAIVALMVLKPTL